ncbi:D-alanyl-D-alanine carboxypeptidase family protein [Paenibacillus sp. WLX2291]|uniref:M15 family metallopeptidase n=1 Tax=Paenibacillus sp. WLX2291 TaxID=3296934 RepID=UPI00398417CA
MKKQSSWKWALPAGVLMSGLVFAGCAGTQPTASSGQASSTTGTQQTDNGNNTNDSETSNATDSTNNSTTGSDSNAASGTDSSSNTGTTQTGASSSGSSSDNGQSSDATSNSGTSDSNESSSTDASSDAASLIQQREDSSLQSTIEKKDGKMVVTNPESLTVIANKERFLPDGYVPPDLVVPDVAFSYDGVLEKSHMRKKAAAALEQLFAAAKKEGLDLRAVSGYRSYKRQVAIYNNNVATKGKAYTDRVSARPGTSEHQTGLAIDVSGPGIGYGLEQSFGATAEGKWLKKNAPDYGFVIRYTENGESKTGYTWEPWHIRYIGKDLAEDVTAKGLTLEEYFDQDTIKN